MNKIVAAAAISASSIIAPFTQAFGVGLQGACRYYLHIKDGAWGWYSSCSGYNAPLDNTVLEVYKIVRDGDGNPSGLGNKVPSNAYRQDTLGSTGYNYILEVTTISQGPSDTYAIPNEQLALVVKSGNTEIYRSYTALSPCHWGSVSVDGFEVSGILDGSFSDGNNDGLNDEWVEAYEGDPTGGSASDYFPIDKIALKDWRILDESARKATVVIDGMDTHAYSIRWTTDLNRTGKTIAFATSNGGSESDKFIYHDSEEEPGGFSQQVWFTLPDPKTEGAYYVGIAVDGVLAAYTKIAPAGYTITWLNDDGTAIDTTNVYEGDTPSHADPSKADDGVYSFQFAGWSPVIEAAISNTTYTATYTKVVDLSKLSAGYTAVDGDVLTNSTAYAVTIPGGASVTINGVAVQGAGGSGASIPDPAFAEDGESVTTKFSKKAGDGNVWTITAFAEMSNESRGTDVAASQVKVYRAGSLEELKTAEAMTEGVTVTEKASAVKVTLEAEAPGDAGQQFFKVKFGE